MLQSAFLRMKKLAAVASCDDQKKCNNQKQKWLKKFFKNEQEMGDFQRI